ncbi:MAG: hypothetical protein NZM29_02850 [Nitrospira sp.]|nr:hypothetical protein [Nitrospira sp.]
MVERLNSPAEGFFSSRSSFAEERWGGNLVSGADVVKRAQPSRRPGAPEGQEERFQQLIEAGREFEAYFISYLLKVMRDTVPQGAIADRQGAYFHFFSDEEIGRRAAESGGIGISRLFQAYAEQQGLLAPKISQVLTDNNR